MHGYVSPKPKHAERKILPSSSQKYSRMYLWICGSWETNCRKSRISSSFFLLSHTKLLTSIGYKLKQLFIYFTLGGISTNLYLSTLCQHGGFISCRICILRTLVRLKFCANCGVIAVISLQAQPTWLLWSSLINGPLPPPMKWWDHDNKIYIEWHNGNRKQHQSMKACCRGT